ncbi:MAG: protein kinase [Anaerolineaceae bacterium]|nr:protein kinase [Anaerolineaceae bacterium]
MDIQKDQARSSTLYDQLIDQYKLEAHINQTAVTDLYRAFDVDENRTVAVEILLPTFNNKKQFAEQFVAKMNKVAKLKHPNIAQVYQIGVTPNDRPYIARDLVEGITLRERLIQLSQQSSPANTIYALKIVRQMAEALELAERLELYHYYLSPDTIQLKQDGTVVVVDLGVPMVENGMVAKMAHALDADNHAYVAPEQHQGKPINSRSQIYSMSVILYEILTNELPEEPIPFWRTIIQGILPKNTTLEQKRPDLSRETYDLLEKGLRAQPWGRYGSIKEYLEAVNEALQSERLLVQTRGETAVLAPPAPRRSRLGLAVAVVTLIVCIASAGIWALVQNANNAEPTQPAIVADSTTTNDVLPSPTLNLTAEGAASQPTNTPPAVELPTLGTIDVLAPADETEFEAGDTANFRWTWSEALQENQQFSVYLLTENGRSLLGTISTPTSDGTYTLQTLLPESSSPSSEWQIVLEDLNTNRNIATSSNRRINIKPAPATPTFTPTPTASATATATSSPTPIPQVEVSVSSASLRQGPDTVFPILRYLYEGDVVAVLAKDTPAGDWYNVILDDGTRGWLAAIAVRPLDETSINTVGIAVTLPARPTNTPTPTPTNTPTPTYTPTIVPGGGGGGGSNPPSPTNTPNPTIPPLPTVPGP